MPVAVVPTVGLQLAASAARDFGAGRSGAAAVGFGPATSVAAQAEVRIRREWAGHWLPQASERWDRDSPGWAVPQESVGNALPG